MRQRHEYEITTILNVTRHQRTKAKLRVHLVLGCDLYMGENGNLPQAWKMRFLVVVEYPFRIREGNATCDTGVCSDAAHSEIHVLG